MQIMYFIINYLGSFGHQSQGLWQFIYCLSFHMKKSLSNALYHRANPRLSHVALDGDQA